MNPDTPTHELQAAIDAILADPEATKRSIFAAIERDFGHAWFRANLRYLEEEWKYAAQLFGL